MSTPSWDEGIGELAAGLEGGSTVGTARHGTARPVAPIEVAVVAEVEVDVAVGAVVHVATEAIVVEGVVVDVDRVPAIIVLDADLAVDHLPVELAVVVVIVAAIGVVVFEVVGGINPYGVVGVTVVVEQDVGHGEKAGVEGDT